MSNESGYNHRNICSKDSFELGDTKQIQLKDTVCEISSDKMTCSPSCNSREISCDQMIDDLGDESYKKSGTEQGHHGTRNNVTIEKGVQPDTNRQVNCINNDSELMASKQNEEHHLTVRHSYDGTHFLENVNGNINYKTNTECEEKNAENQHIGGNCNIKSNLLENSDHRCFPFFDEVISNIPNDQESNLELHKKEIIGRTIKGPTPSYEDNDATIHQIQKDKLTPRIKHLNIRMTWLHEQEVYKHMSRYIVEQI